MLKARIYTVLVLLPLLLSALYFAPPRVWGGILMILLAVAAWEWGALAGWPAAGRWGYVLGMTAGSGLLWYCHAANGTSWASFSQAAFGISLAFWVMIVPLWLRMGWRVRSPLLLAASGAVLLLPTWLAMFLLQRDPWRLLMLMGIVWISDTAAYFCGKRWGRRKLAPYISPGKTWAGAYGALAGVAVYYAVLGAGGWTGHDRLGGITGCGIFLLLAVLGMEGDLFESWIKRTAGVKDSGTIFPGHGGMLDRIDALLPSLPAAALLLSRA